MSERDFSSSMYSFTDSFKNSFLQKFSHLFYEEIPQNFGFQKYKQDLDKKFVEKFPLGNSRSSFRDYLRIFARDSTRNFWSVFVRVLSRISSQTTPDISERCCTKLFLNPPEVFPWNYSEVSHEILLNSFGDIHPRYLRRYPRSFFGQNHRSNVKNNLCRHFYRNP